MHYFIANSYSLIRGSSKCKTNNSCYNPLKGDKKKKVKDDKKLNERKKQIAIFLANKYEVGLRNKCSLNTITFGNLDQLLQSKDYSTWKVLQKLGVKRGRIMGYCYGGDGDPFIINKIHNEYHEGDIIYGSFSGFSHPNWDEMFGFELAISHAQFRHLLSSGWGGQPSIYNIYPFIQCNVAEKDIKKIRKLYQ